MIRKRLPPILFTFGDELGGADSAIQTSPTHSAVLPHRARNLRIPFRPHSAVLSHRSHNIRVTDR